VLARYQPPGSDSPSQFDVSSGEQLDELLARAADHFGDRGIPAVELTSDDGSTLVMGQTRRGAVLLWIDAQGESRHSVGSGSTEDMVFFDYFGSYTEVPAEFVVSSEMGRAAALAFVNGESPAAVSGLALDPD
jgi:hypothetical protein